MTDPISIISLVDIVFGKCLQLYKFVSSVAEAGDEIKHLLWQLEGFQRLLPYVKAFAEQIEISPSSTDNNVAQDTIRPTLQACQVEFQAIFVLTDCHNPAKLSTLKGAAKRVSWVLDGDRVQDLSKKLDTAKMNMSLALQISGRFIDLDIGQKIGQVIENQEILYSELRKSLQVFTCSIRQSVERDLERYNDSNIKTEVRMEDLYESMSTGFPSLDHIEVPAEPLFPNIEGTNDASNNTKMTVSRARTFKENDADFERVLREFKNSSLLERLGEQTGSADLNVILENIERQNMDRQTRGFATSKSRMLSGVNAWTSLLPSQSTNAILSSYTMLLQASKASENTFELMVEGLAEASDAIRLCKREYDLYPAPEVKEAMIKLYSHVLVFGAEAAMITKKSFAGRFIHAMTFQDGPIPKLIVKIQKQARAIMQEVEYQQRLEMRDMSSRVRHIERDQQKILSGIASQRKILESLRDQHSIMSMIKTQQEILDGVQKLLLRISA